MPNRELSAVRVDPRVGLVGRLLVATILFYAVAVLYAGTSGAAGRDMLIQPIIITAVFAGVLCVPMAVGWFVVRRLTAA